jgi:hypothetical protein
VLSLVSGISPGGAQFLFINIALSILEKLQVPDGWCSSGLSANEYTAIVLILDFEPVLPPP